MPGYTEDGSHSGCYFASAKIAVLEKNNFLPHIASSPSPTGKQKRFIVGKQPSAPQLPDEVTAEVGCVNSRVRTARLGRFGSIQ